MSEPRKLTSGQQHFLRAVAQGKSTLFHRRVIEPIEGLPYGKKGGLVRWTGGIRLVGCNILSTGNFALTDEGLSAMTSQQRGAP